MSALLVNSINMFFKLLYLLILVRVFLSWVPAIAHTAIGGIVYALTEPIMGPVRRMMDKSPLGGGMMLDFSPVIALFLLDIIQMILLYLVRMF